MLVRFLTTVSLLGLTFAVTCAMPSNGKPDILQTVVSTYNSSDCSDHKASRDYLSHLETTFEEWCGPNGPCANCCPVPPNDMRVCMEDNATRKLDCFCNGVSVLEGEASTGYTGVSTSRALYVVALLGRFVRWYV